MPSDSVDTIPLLRSANFQVSCSELSASVSPMPRKIRQLITDLRKAGFINTGGKGGHSEHPKGVVISGNLGNDAVRNTSRLSSGQTKMNVSSGIVPES